MPKPLERIELSLPETAALKQSVNISARIATSDGGAAKAILPVRLEIRDANGNLAEGSGFHAAKNGELQVTLDLAPNDEPGTWEVRVQELASGMETVQWMRVTRPN